MSKANKNIEFDLFDTYLAYIKNSVETKLFSETYAFVNGEKQEITEAGRWSCAVFVSSLLRIFGLLKEQHSGMPGLLKDMENSGWYEISKPREGAVVWWEKTPQSNGHEHVGFYVGGGKAISNSWKEKTPVEHGLASGTTEEEKERPIKSVWWHPKLDR